MTSLGQNIRSPSLSRQGGKLAFVRRVGDTDVWWYEWPSGTKRAPPRKLIASTQIDMEARISPDGTRIVFVSHRSGNGEIWICDRDGANLVQLTALEGVLAGSPRWSPDGRQIAFDAATEGNWDIFVISADGGSERALTDDAGEDLRPSWSHDGKWIYFNSRRGGARQIWKAPAAGGAAVQVTKGGGFQALESPDGRYLYFGKGRNESALWRKGLEGGEEEFVLEGSQSFGFWGRWHIADEGLYYVDYEKGPDSGRWALKLFRFDTGKVEEVMELPRPPAGGGSVDIARDGKGFLYPQSEPARSDLMLVENFR